MKVPPALLLCLPQFKDGKPLERSAETLAFLDAHRAELARYGIEVVVHPCHGDWDNYNGWLKVWWEPKTLLHLDHDNVPTVDMLLKLQRCAWPACTQVYRWAKVNGDGDSAIVDTPVYEDVPGEMYVAVDWHRDGPIPQWCDRTGFGLIKLDFQTRIRHPLPPMAVTYVGFDSLYSGMVKLREPCFKWHVHRLEGPDPYMVHNH